MTLRACECGGVAEIRTEKVAEDTVETWAECTRCKARTEEIEDAYPDPLTAAWHWNRGDRKEKTP